MAIVKKNKQMQHSESPKNNIEIYLVVPDFTLRGGIERFCTNLANSLAKEVNIKIISLHKSYNHFFYKIAPDVSVTYISDAKFSRLYKFTTLISCVRFYFSHLRKCKNCFIIGMSPIINIYLVLLFPSLAKKIIASEHSSYYSHGRIVRLLRALLYKKIRGVVTQTAAGVSAFLEDGVAATRIPNAVTDFDHPDQWRKKGPIKDSSSISFLSLARLEKVKQLDHVVILAEILKDKYPGWKFYIIGEGPLRSELEDLIFTKELGSSVILLTATQSPEEYYSKADFYIITSSSEAFPMSMIESLSFGIPVISYDALSGPGEILLHNFNGFLVAQNNPLELAEELIRQANSHFATYEELSKNSIVSVSDFSSNSLVTKWLELLE